MVTSFIKERIVVIGNGMVGYKFCERLSDKDTAGQFQIITFCEEPRIAYDRVHLSEYFAGKSPEDLTMAALSWYEERDIEIHVGDSVVSIDRENRTVTSAKGITVNYDKIVMATGSAAFVPPVPGIEKDGVFVYRTIEDLEAITAYAKHSKRCAVIGGGLLGLEAAKAAMDLGLETEVVEFAPRLMARQVDTGGGEMLKSLIESRGIGVNLSKNTKNIAGDGKVTAMEFADDTTRDVETDQPMVMKTPSVNFQDDPAYIERFLMEEWIGRRVDHPNLVKLLRSRQEPQFLYFLLEHIQGESLGTWIQNHAQQPDIQEVVRIIGEVIAGVRALHRKETLHQDIKPDNIMLDAEGHVKLIDYGSCRVASIREIEVPYERQTALGTVDFSAPEYRLDMEPNISADQFSIAMLTYHMLTGGKEPYGAKWEKSTTLRDFSLLEYTPSFKHQPMVPYWMDGALKKALTIRPESRYQTLSEFLHDLKHPNPAFLEARNLPLLERDPLLFWKWLSALLAAALILSLCYRS